MGVDRLAQSELSAYRTLSLAGEDAQAAVYRGVQQSLEREVAIKILKRGVPASAEARQRFRRAMAGAAKLTHEHLAWVLDFGETNDGSPCVISEWVEGRSLALALAEGAPFPPERAAHLLRGIASALLHGHQLGVIHRDLRPAKVLLGPRLKLLDFGLARAMELSASPESGADPRIGRAEYLAPELVRRAEPTAAVDLYALGALLYEMLTGAAPFSAGDSRAVLRAQLDQFPRPPPRAQGLGPLALRLLEKDPSRRLQSAGDVVRYLDDLQLAPWTIAEPTAPAPAPAPWLQRAVGRVKRWLDS